MEGRGSAATGVASGAGSRCRIVAGIHTASAATATSDQNASAVRQFPNDCSRPGVTADPRAPPPCSAAVYMPVINPTRAGNDPLITTGMSTLIKAIPAQASRVAPITTYGPSRDLTPKPTARATSPTAIVRLVPIRADKAGAARPAAAKHNVGSVVSRPAHF